MRANNQPTFARSVECRRFSLLGDVYTILLAGQDTGGRYAWVEATIGPGNGPPPHYHSREDEAFYVLEGELAFVVDGRQVAAPAGTVLHVPRGVAHAFKNETETCARMLVQTIPAGFEKMVADCGQPASAETVPTAPQYEQVKRFFAAVGRYGIEFRSPRMPD